MAVPLLDGFGSIGPCGEVTTLTTNSTTTLSPWSRAVYVATDGDLVVTLAGQAAVATPVSVTFTVVAGSFLPIRVWKVHSCPAGTLALW